MTTHTTSGIRASDVSRVLRADRLYKFVQVRTSRKAVMVVTGNEATANAYAALLRRKGYITAPMVDYDGQGIYNEPRQHPDNIFYVTGKVAQSPTGKV